MTKQRPRTFTFDDRTLTRPQIIAAISAALDDEGLALTQGSWGRVTIGIRDGAVVAYVPSTTIIERSTTHGR